MPQATCEFLDRVALLQVAGAQVGEKRHGPWLGHAQRELADERGVGDLPGLDRFAVRGRVDQPVDVVVVAVGLVHEPPPVRAHPDAAGLGPVHDVRERPGASAAERDQRDRAPGGRGLHVGVEAGSHGLAHGDAVAGGLLGASDQCSRPVGVLGNSAARRVTSCGKPPAASTTPRVAVILSSPSGELTTTPVTRPSASVSRRCAGVETRMSTPRSSAEFSSRPMSAVPLTSCILRRWVSRS